MIDDQERNSTAAQNGSGQSGATSAATPSPGALSDIIGDIYDCVLRPGNWEATLGRINQEFGFANSILGIFPLEPGPFAINVTVGIDQEWRDIDLSYQAESVALWGGTEHAWNFPLDEPVICSQLPTYPLRHSNRYFRDVLDPRGLIDAAVITLARESGLMGYAAFNRHKTRGLIDEIDVCGLRLLGPHLRRAATISHLFDLKAVEVASFASVLDGFTFGLLLVDEKLGIVHANAAARAMLAERDPIRSEKGLLTLPARTSQAALERAMQQSTMDEARLGPQGIGIPVRRIDGAPCVIHLLPLQRSEMRRGLAPRATAAIFVAPATSRPRAPTDALALLYDLTPAETRIFELLASGMTQAAIGEFLGIATSTVKTHVLRLFEKTGCKRQADLLKLATELSAPV